MPRLAVKFANFPGNGMASRRGAVLLVGRAPANLLASCGEDPTGTESWFDRAACPRVGVNSQEAPQLVGRDGRLRFDLDEIEPIEVRSEVRSDGLPGKRRNRSIDRDEIARTAPKSPGGGDRYSERDQPEAEFGPQVHAETLRRRRIMAMAESALFRPGARKCGSQTQGDESTARHVPLGSPQVHISAEKHGCTASSQGPDRIAAPAHYREQHTQLKDLQGGMPARGVNELRQKGQKKQSRLRVK